MPKYYCDYCDIFLTHDSASVRKAHNTGWKHINQVAAYYRELEPEKTEEIIDIITNAHGGQLPPIQMPSREDRREFRGSPRYSSRRGGRREGGREGGRDGGRDRPRRYDRGPPRYDQMPPPPPPHMRYPPPGAPYSYGDASGQALSAPPQIRDNRDRM